LYATARARCSFWPYFCSYFACRVARGSPRGQFSALQFIQHPRSTCRIVVAQGLAAAAGPQFRSTMGPAPASTNSWCFFLRFFETFRSDFRKHFGGVFGLLMQRNGQKHRLLANGVARSAARHKTGGLQWRGFLWAFGAKSGRLCWRAWRTASTAVGPPKKKKKQARKKSGEKRPTFPLSFFLGAPFKRYGLCASAVDMPPQMGTRSWGRPLFYYYS
jgi:hypothetical protein